MDLAFGQRPNAGSGTQVECCYACQKCVSACQQCERTLARATRRKRGPRDERMRVMDVAEMLWASLKGEDR
jgi:hypothetical protein